MTPVLVGCAGLVLLLVLMLIRIPVAIAMALVGMTGLTILNSWPAAVATLLTEAWTVATYYELTVIPLFVLMGNMASISGMSKDLYAAANAWVGGVRGGLAHATVIGCTGFAALSGSSVASALTLGKVAMPEMARFGYDKKLSAGAVAAGGTLGILIPPSTGFVIYAILTEESIGRLFLAGIIPGLILATLFLVTIYIQTLIKPEIAPRTKSLPVAEKIATLRRASSIVFIIFITIGGIYGGVFTPVEAAAVGAMLSFVFAYFRKSLALKPLGSALLQSVSTTVMIFLVIIGANIFSPFLALTGIPESLANTLLTFEIGPIFLLAIILITFIFLGTFLDGFAMMVLVLPIVLPIIIQSKIPELLDIAGSESDLKIWFGVIMVIVIEMAMISPPVGMNVFVVKGISKGISMKEIYIGILPFWVAMMVCLIILITFPQLALFLPSTMI